MRHDPQDRMLHPASPGVGLPISVDGAFPALLLEVWHRCRHRYDGGRPFWAARQPRRDGLDWLRGRRLHTCRRQGAGEGDYGSC